MKTETAAGETTETTEVEETTVEETTEAEGAEKDAGAADDQAGETPAKEDAPPVEDEVVVTIGDEAPTPEDEEVAKAPQWVRDLRASQRELTRQNRELQRQLEEKSQPAKADALGPKPTMADPEIDYDAAKFEAALTKWNDRKRAADNESAQRQADEKKALDAWNERLADYGTKKSQLKVKDFAESEAVVSDALNKIQQGIIVQGAENAAIVIHALGKNSAKLKELAAITDPVKFAFAVAKLEKDLKVTTKKAPPPPERTVTGSAPKSGVVDSQLERLRADAEKTGDYTKVNQYNQQKRKAS